LIVREPLSAALRVAPGSGGSQHLDLVLPDAIGELARKGRRDQRIHLGPGDRAHTGGEPDLGRRRQRASDIPDLS